MNEVRKDFPILKEKVGRNKLVYLDSSSTSQKPKVVMKAIQDFYQTTNANVHRGLYLLAQKSTMAYEDAHQTVANFIGAEFEEIVFTKGTTESLNLLATILTSKLKRGDEIVLTEMEHHSNIVPWQQLAKRKGLKIRYIPVKENYELDLRAARKLINAKTKIVSVTHMSNVLGTINPIYELTILAHSHGAYMIVDAAQSVPHMPVNVKDLECDFLVFSGHKMLAPTGIGVLYGMKEHLLDLEPYQFGGDMINEVTFNDATWNNLPWKFEAGTPPIAQAVGLAAAIKYLKKLDMKQVQEHGLRMSRYMLKKLKEVEGLKIIGPEDPDKRGPVFSFTMKGIHPHDISDIVNKLGVAVRGGHHCAMPLMKSLNLQGTTRVSTYIYNVPKDIDVLVNSLKKVNEVFA